MRLLSLVNNQLRPMLSHFTDLFAYNQWAYERLLQPLLLAEPPLPLCNQLFAHLLAAETIWLARLRDETFTTPVFPDLPLKTSAIWMKKNHQDWLTYLDSLEDIDLESVCVYTTTTGETHETIRKDIIQHVLNHGTHHRAQISMLLRQAGIAPPPTDFIFYLRAQKT